MDPRLFIERGEKVLSMALAAPDAVFLLVVLVAAVLWAFKRQQVKNLESEISTHKASIEFEKKRADLAAAQLEKLEKKLDAPSGSPRPSLEALIQTPEARSVIDEQVRQKTMTHSFDPRIDPSQWGQQKYSLEDVYKAAVLNRAWDAGGIAVSRLASNVYTTTSTDSLTAATVLAGPTPEILAAAKGNPSTVTIRVPTGGSAQVVPWNDQPTKSG